MKNSFNARLEALDNESNEAKLIFDINPPEWPKIPLDVINEEL